MNAHQTIISDLLCGIRLETRQSVPQCYYIVGKRGYGKSYVLQALSCELSHDDAYNVIFFDCLMSPIFDMSTFDCCVGDGCSAEKRTVLLLDNFDFWLEKWTKLDLYKLRARLYEEGAPIIVGTGTVLSSQFTSYDEPFYDAFLLRTIPELSVEQSMLLISSMRMDNGENVCDKNVSQNILDVLSETEKSPYVCKMISEQPVLDCAKDELLKNMLSQLTPCYRAVIGGMTAPQCKTFITLLKSDRPMLMSELRDATGQTGGELTPQIKAFSKKNLLKSDRISVKKTLYSISDALMVAWYRYCCRDVGAM